MARKVETVSSYQDDLDGSKGAETISFSIDGAAFQFDLNKRNAKAIRAEFDNWTTYPREAPATRRGKRPKRAATPKADSAASASGAKQRHGQQPRAYPPRPSSSNRKRPDRSIERRR